VLEICRAVLTGRGPDGDELKQTVLDAADVIGAEFQTPGLPIAAQQLLQTRLVNGHLAAIEPLHTRGIDVDADDMVAGFGQTGTRHQPDVARAKNRYFHW